MQRYDLAREKAKQLRNDGLAIQEICAALNLGKSTVYHWIKDIPLQRERVHRSVKVKKDRGQESIFHKSYPPTNMTRSQKCQIAESAVLFRLALNNFQVLKSVASHDRFDWVVLVGSRSIKIQVKWARTNHGLSIIPLGSTPSSGRGRVRYKNEDFDIIVGYNYYNDTAYVYTFEETRHLKTGKSITADGAERWDKLRKIASIPKAVA